MNTESKAVAAYTAVISIETAILATENTIKAMRAAVATASAAEEALTLLHTQHTNVLRTWVNARYNAGAISLKTCNALHAEIAAGGFDPKTLDECAGTAPDWM